MIVSIMRDVADELKAKGVPFECIYGPERFKPTTLNRPRIVFERPEKADGAAFNQNAGQLTRSLGVQITVFAQSTLSGANVYDHERLADLVVDQVMRALYTVAKKRKTFVRPSGPWGKLSAAELELIGIAAWPGIAYAMPVEFDRGLPEVNWQGETAETATFADPNDPEDHGVRITSRTEVHLNDSTGASETGCGG